MGLRRALSLGIVKGRSTEQTIIPLCPNEHDPASLERILGKSKTWKTAKWVAAKGSQMINQPNIVDDQLVLFEAMLQHDKECGTGLEGKRCHCTHCDNRRMILQSQQ